MNDHSMSHTPIKYTTKPDGPVRTCALVESSATYVTSWGETQNMSPGHIRTSIKGEKDYGVALLAFAQTHRYEPSLGGWVKATGVSAYKVVTPHSIVAKSGGVVEAEGSATAGSWVVQDDITGDTWVMPEEAFLSRYEPVDRG